MAKKELTTIQKKKRYNKLEKLFEGSSYLSAITPFITIGIVNYNKYFVEYDGTKMSIAFVLAMAVMGFALWGITKKKLENTFVSFLIKWTTFALIFSLMGQLITDVSTIMWFGLIGLVGSFGFDSASKKMKQKKDRVIKSMQDAEDENNKNQYAEELKKNGK